MSEKKKKEPKYYTEKTWGLDCRLALHQRLIWLLCAVLAIALGVLIMQLLPPVSARTGVIILAMALMLGYQWAARAPQRAMNGWIIQYNEKKVQPQAVLDYVEQLEKRLPAMKKKEMAFTLTEARAIMMFRTGKQQEALALLEGFDRCWDKDQRQRLVGHIAVLKEKMGQTPDEKEENP